ncbi:N-acetylmuramoyl-L-alanine amidase [Streptomyces sp. SA15]|uniref:peptidoglycan recognition protein family protein n=1 Tax=Streptomyces sp. SA15 TaxID=934019 RepID=UPI000BAF728C|nr:peptidoglycan recognition protein [Streptomyces sp. SA15]PAZ10814.1 N-acetylmuramoyl-L-alanine amidase [Streptomyces sp. SA15]
MRTAHGGGRARWSWLKRRTWVALGAVLAGGGVAVAAVAATGSGADFAAPAAQAPIRTHVHSLRLTGASASLRTLGARSTAPFSMVGVTWNGARAVLHGTVEVRTRSAASGHWTPWLKMGQPDDIPDPAELNRPGVRGGMSPMWSGPSTGVQVRASGTHGTAALPTGLRVDLIDPGKASTTGRAAGSGLSPAAYAMDATATETATAQDTVTPTDTGTGTGTGAATDSATPTDTATAAGSASPTDTTATPTATDSASASPSTGTSASAPASASASTSTSASPSASATSWPSQLPTMAQAYPSCPNSSASPSASASPTPPDPMPAATTSTVAPPAVVTRAGWGADECAREAGYPLYGSAVKVMFVHHTDTTNNYSCADSPAIVRSIYAEHLNQGWRDIGYNFLVDKCGTVFEGRFGGMALPVVGAHTYGFNTNSMGVAAIGTYTDLSGGDSTASTFPGATPSKAMLGAIARLAAWKFGMTGVNPGTGTAYLPEGASDSYGFTLGTSYKFNVVSGHRDGYATDCPGNQLYNALSTVRAYAAGPVGPVTVTGMSGGAAKSGTSYYTKGAATVSWTTSTPSAVISGFDVLVDGKAVAHTSGSARSASISVAAGSHTVQVRATHVRGSTTLSAGVGLVGDTTAPTFPTAPGVKVRTGTVSSTAVPVTVTWKAADNAALAKVLATAPSSATFGPTVTSWNASAKPGASDLFVLKAYDVAGNSAGASVYRTPNIIQETSTTRTGTWTRKSSTSYLGGYSYSSSSAGASISWTFTGRSVAWIVSRAATSGQAYIYIDGTKVTTVDLKSSTTLYRQAIWTKTWSTSAKHTLKIVVVGTSGRPTVTTDAIATIG